MRHADAQHAGVSVSSHDPREHDHTHDAYAHGRGSHRHGHDQAHGHTHGTVDPEMLSSVQGISAVKWSLVILACTAVVQIVVVVLTGSVALLADTVHNAGDALTAVPLWIAFSYARRPATRRYTYGFGRVEDLAGIAVVLAILFSALFAGYESVLRIVHPETITHLGALAAAALVGFLGNEAVAQLRIRTGRRIASVALIADGHHARIDGFTSLAVLAGAIGVWLGFPLADPIVGLVIALAILHIVWQSARSVFSRAIDGVDPKVVDEIHESLAHTPGVVEVTETRVRWLGHRMLAEVNVAVPSGLSVEEGHAVAVQVRHQLLHRLQYLSDATVHVDPDTASGQEHHRMPEHRHDDLPVHSH
jgi:cation diffusion facilitator family transporter